MTAVESKFNRCFMKGFGEKNCKQTNKKEQVLCSLKPSYVRLPSKEVFSKVALRETPKIVIVANAAIL